MITTLFKKNFDLIQWLRRWQTRTQFFGHNVAHDVFLCEQTEKHLLRTQNVSERNQKHFCVSDTNFVFATNVARGRNRETFVSAGKARLKIVSQSRISETSEFENNLII